jgi:hypothetical protein
VTLDDPTPTNDKAEQVALWAPSASLESVLTEPLDPNYDDVINRARLHLADDGTPEP